jgi:hypothetical protein
LTFTEAENRLEMIQVAIEAVAEQMEYNLGKNKEIKEERDYVNSVQL